MTEQWEFYQHRAFKDFRSCLLTTPWTANPQRMPLGILLFHRIISHFSYKFDLATHFLINRHTSTSVDTLRSIKRPLPARSTHTGRGQRRKDAVQFKEQCPNRTANSVCFRDIAPAYVYHSLLFVLQRSSIEKCLTAVSPGPSTCTPLRSNIPKQAPA